MDTRPNAVSNTPQPPPPPPMPLRALRIAVAGFLMGVANLIPGVSGGTMVLAMGIYQEFIDSVADVTALRFSTRRIVFLGILGVCALLAIKGLAAVILYLLFHYPVAMYALFIGLTLGGAPVLLQSLRPLRADVIVAAGVGIGAMVAMLFLREGGAFPHGTMMDGVAGVIGAMTMVLPGVSGSYVLLVMGQYERVIGAVKDLDWRILAPVAVGAVVGIIGLAHLLKLLLHRCPRATMGVLLGILLGSVIGLWPFGKPPGLKALEDARVEDLRTFVEHWQIPELEQVADEELPVRIIEGWDSRQRSSYSPASVIGASVAVVIGFLLTGLLGRKKRAGAQEMERSSTRPGAHT